MSLSPVGASSRLGGLKWVAALAGAVLLLVAVWLFFGPSGTTPSTPPPVLAIPSGTATGEDLVRAAEQLFEYQPTPKNVALGILLLRFLNERLSEAEWPKAAEAVFAGWTRIHRTPGSRPELDSVAADLLERMTSFLGTRQLEALIRSSNGNDFYKPWIEAALDREALRPVPRAGYAGSRLAALVAAAACADDYPRAARYLERPQIEEGAPSEVRLEVARVSRVVRLYLDAKAGKPDMRATVEEWSRTPKDPVAGPALLKAVVEGARAGRASGDFRLLRQSMEETRELAGAKKYWVEAIEACVASVREKGRYTEEHSLAALATAYGEAFAEPTFAYEFWRKRAEESKAPSLPEAMWRVECLKKAFAGAADDPARLDLVRKIVGEYESFGEHALPAKLLETLAPRFEGGASKGEVAALLADLRAKEESDKVLAARKRKEQEEFRLRGEVAFLKRRLDEFKRRNAPAEEIVNIERSIRELERKLPE